jgi:hypothetical protein
MDRCSSDEQQLYQLLCLLDVPIAASQHGVEIVPASFRKPNAKGLELVLIRLFAIIHGEGRAAKVRFVWPMGSVAMVIPYQPAASGLIHSLHATYRSFATAGLLLIVSKARILTRQAA